MSRGQHLCWPVLMCVLGAVTASPAASKGSGRRDDLSDIRTLAKQRASYHRHRAPDAADCTSEAGWGLWGRDWGCCGSYDSCCIYASSVCYLHDALCRCCHMGRLLCGPLCRPDPQCRPLTTTTTATTTVTITGTATTTLTTTTTASSPPPGVPGSAVKDGGKADVRDDEEGRGGEDGNSQKNVTPNVTLPPLGAEREDVSPSGGNDVNSDVAASAVPRMKALIDSADAISRDSRYTGGQDTTLETASIRLPQTNVNDVSLEDDLLTVGAQPSPLDPHDVMQSDMAPVEGSGEEEEEGESRGWWW